MDEELRRLLEVLAAERDAAQIVARLVSEGFTRDDALALVAFPDQ